LDSIPLVCITGQVPTHLIGNDAFQECDTVGITRPCTSTIGLVRDVNGPRQGAARGVLCRDHRPSRPVLVDVPKDVQFATGTYHPPRNPTCTSPTPRASRAMRPDPQGGSRCCRSQAAGDLFGRRRHQFRSRGLEAAARVVEFTGFPITSTLMGLAALSRIGQELARHARMHGTYEANMAMH